MILHEKIETQLPGWRDRVRSLAKEHGGGVVGAVTVGEVVGGERDTKGLGTDISYVDPNEGIRFRGMTVNETLKALPKGRGNKIPMVGGWYYVLMVGDVLDIPILSTSGSESNLGEVSPIPLTPTPDYSILHNDNLSTSPLQRNIMGLVLLGAGVVTTIALVLWRRRPAKNE